MLLVILPLSGTLTAFYVWTLNALNLTIKDLVERKQTVKAMMYKKLWWCILGSILVIFGFFFINSFSFAGSKDPDFVPDHWQTRWFLLDGWLNLVYLVDLAFVSYIWRPTRNNRRFAMSDEVRCSRVLLAPALYWLLAYVSILSRLPKTMKASRWRPSEGLSTRRKGVKARPAERGSATATRVVQATWAAKTAATGLRCRNLTRRK